MPDVSASNLARQMRTYQRMRESYYARESEETDASWEEVDELLGELAANLYDSAVLLGRLTKLFDDLSD